MSTSNVKTVARAADEALAAAGAAGADPDTGAVVGADVDAAGDAGEEAATGVAREGGLS
jgi:hypothetical protein